MDKTRQQQQDADWHFLYYICHYCCRVDQTRADWHSTVILGQSWYQVTQKFSWRSFGWCSTVFTIIPRVFEENWRQKCITEAEYLPLTIRFDISTSQTTYKMIPYICDKPISADDISQSIHRSGSRILQEIWSLNLRCVMSLNAPSSGDHHTLMM